MQPLASQNFPLQKQSFTSCTASFLKRNQSQLVLILVAIIPTVMIVSSTFVTLWYLQSSSITIIKQFADELYQDQINSSKLQNAGLVFQINQEVQKISWQLNLINEYLGKIIQGNVVQNQNYIPALLNIDRTYTNKENPKLLSLFKQNSYLTSGWHLVSQDHFNQLNSTQKEQLMNATRIDFLWRAIMFDNNQKEKQQRWLKIKSMFLGYVYDGLLYGYGQNTTYQAYQIPSNCPYTGAFRLDIRCRYYYLPTMGNQSTIIFPPSVQFGSGLTYVASIVCERRLQYAEDDPNSSSSGYSLLCITLYLSDIPQYFSNFGSNSKFQMFLDPYSQIVIYDSSNPLQVGQIADVQQQETAYLQDQAQSAIFLNNINQSSQFIINSMNSISLENTNTLTTNQQTFDYIRNGTDCFVIMNSVTIVDKMPSFEYLRSVNPSPKYQLKNIFLFLDVLSKQKMLEYSQSLEKTIKLQNTIFTYTSWGIIFLILTVQFYYSTLLGRRILVPVIHLTRILKQIRIQNAKTPLNVISINKLQLDAQQQMNDTQNNFTSVLSEMSIDLDNQIKIDEQVDSDFEGVCFSSDTQILLESFQNLFKILRFTTQNLYKENESISLLNLNIQIQHFQQFGNHRALGVCHNNMGVIHYNCGRYQEAIENFQKAIIYAKYELNLYSHEGDGINFSKNIKRFTVNLRTSFQSRSSSSQNTELQQMSSQDQQQLPEQQAQAWSSLNPHSQNSENVLLFWNLYNRNENYLKAMTLYFKMGNHNLWDLYQEVALENMCISQLFLPPSNKREMLNYYTLLLSYYHLNLVEDQNTILNKYSLLYLKNIDAKMNSMFLNQNNSQSMQESTDQTSFQLNQASQFAALFSSSTGKDSQNSVILFSPMQKQYKQSLYKNFQNRHHLDSIEESILISKPLKNSTKACSDQTKNGLQKNQNEGVRVSRQTSVFSGFHKESQINNNFNMSSHSAIKQPQSLQESEIGLVKKTQDFQRSAVNSQAASFDENNNLIKGISFNTPQQTNHKMLNQTRGYSHSKGNSLFSSKLMGDQITRHTFSSSSSKIQRILGQLKIKYGNKKLEKDKSKLVNQNNQAIKMNRLPKKIFSSRQKSQMTQIFYDVRKIQKTQKVSAHEFSSDIYFTYYALQQAKFQMKQKNYFNAAEILTNVLEHCRLYLPYQKKQILKILQSIFQIQNIHSTELEVMIKKYKKLSLCNQNVCLISVCNSSLSKKRMFALSSDLVNEVLFKEQDSFGILSFLFEEHVYSQLMGFTQIKTIRSNPQFFEEIFYSIIAKRQENTNEKREQKNQNQKNEKECQQLFSPLSQKIMSETSIVQKDNNSVKEFFETREAFNQKDMSALKDSSRLQSNANLKSLNQLEFGTKNKPNIQRAVNTHQQQNKLTSKLPFEKSKNSLLSQSQFTKVGMLKQGEEKSESSTSYNSSEEEVFSSNSQQIKRENKINNILFHPPPSSPYDSKDNSFSCVMNENKQYVNNNHADQIKDDHHFNASFQSQNHYSNLYWQSQKPKRFIHQYKQLDQQYISPDNSYFDLLNLNIGHSRRDISQDHPHLFRQSSKENHQLLIHDLLHHDFHYDTSKSPSLEFNHSIIAKITDEQTHTQTTPLQINQVMKAEDQYRLSNQSSANNIQSDKSNTNLNNNLLHNIPSQYSKLYDLSSPMKFPSIPNENNFIENFHLYDVPPMKAEIIKKNEIILETNSGYQNTQSQQMFPSHQNVDAQYSDQEQNNQQNVEFKKVDTMKYSNRNMKYLDPQENQLKEKEENLDDANSSLDRISDIDGKRSVDYEYKQEEQDESKINIKEQKNKRKISEQIFHFGIHAALKQFLLNSDNKITSYISKKIFKDHQEQDQHKYTGKYNSVNHTYLIYCTDQPLKFSNKLMLQKLSELLLNLNAELLILTLNEKQQLDEFSNLDNISINGQSIISFFNTEEKLLQYIYNYREHLKNYLIPMIVEHF